MTTHLDQDLDLTSLPDLDLDLTTPLALAQDLDLIISINCAVKYISTI